MGVPRAAAVLAVAVLLTAVFIARDAGLMARPDPSLSRPGIKITMASPLITLSLYASQL